MDMQTEEAVSPRTGALIAPANNFGWRGSSERSAAARTSAPSS